MIGRLVSMDPDEVAACAVRGLLAERAVIVPGFLNRCIVALGRHAPPSVVCSVVSAFWGKTAEQRRIARERVGQQPTAYGGVV